MTVVVWDIGNVLLEWQPRAYFARRMGAARTDAFFAAVDLDAANLAVDAGGPFPATIRALAQDHPDWAEPIGWWCDDWLALCAPVIGRSVRLLEALHARDVRCHALTNFGRETFAMARAAHPFLRLFDGATVSAHLGVVKPDPAIYAAVEAATGAAPGDLLFTDDRADNVAAAAARGWRTHLFDGAEGWAARLVAEGLLPAAAAR